MATEKDPKATRKVEIVSSAAGARYVHTTEGAKMIPAGGRATVTMRNGELKDMPEGLKAYKPGEAPEPAPEPQTIQEQDAQDAVEYDADLVDANSSDGLVLRKTLDKIAKDEGVEVAADADKEAVAQAIMAKRAAA